MVDGYDAGSANQFETNIAIEPRPNKAVSVILNSKDLTDHEVLLTPQQAMDIGEVLRQCGYFQIHGHLQEEAQPVTDMVRLKLVQRVTTVMKNLDRRNVQPRRIALELVDIVLREVTK